MIEAEMYGMMPRANTVSRRRFPPEKRSTMPRRPLCIWLKRAASAAASMPGRGHVRAQSVGGQEPQRHQDPALELRNLEDVLEALETFHHFVATSGLASAMISTSASRRLPASGGRTR